MRVLGRVRVLKAPAAVIIATIVGAYSGVLSAQQDPSSTNWSADEKGKSVSSASAESEQPEYTTNGELYVPTTQPANQAEPARRSRGVIESVRATRFYLTDANYATDAVLTACAADYHMASIWELLDPSNLAYAFDHPAAHTKADSGNGPPSTWYGWVRTGRDSSGSATAGSGNCLNWSTTDSGSSGVSIRLSGDWESPGELNGIWEATSFTCGNTGPVWCVED